ncbi:MAG: hypothetical protein OEL89_00750 [Candidatus Peregrinibacteria bacterium]|nr:hypothetical protein [Candidatus Peregrinibacteria bacterium]
MDLESLKQYLNLIKQFHALLEMDIATSTHLFKVEHSSEFRLISHVESLTHNLLEKIEELRDKYD